MVSIHVPLAEHDAMGFLQKCAASTFQFTCPSRSTTGCSRLLYASLMVSIHVPLAEHDLTAAEIIEVVKVSIHVPLAEHDRWRRLPSAYSWSFNSRAPRGARLAFPYHMQLMIGFQFTCPSRSTTR